jgi:3-hydroxyisobutyrate dehydrogenase
MTTPTIGFIGLGLMGTGFTTRLLATGHAVIGYDIDPTKCDAAARRGVTIAASAGDAARRTDLTLVCVMTSQQLDAVVADVCAAGRLDGKVLVDHSTTEMDVTRAAATKLAATGMAFVDAPVSGGPGAAETGTLAIMAGGDAGAIAKIAPVMTHLGRFTHMGAVGAGQATKLVNQTLVLTNYCVIAEALRLAEAYGVDAKKVPEALASGHAGSNLLPVLFERMIARDFAPKGYARQVLKDLEILNSAAKAHHLAMPMSAQALTLFRMLVAAGKSDLDGAAVLTLLPEPHAKS